MGTPVRGDVRVVPWTIGTASRHAFRVHGAGRKETNKDKEKKAKQKGSPMGLGKILMKLYDRREERTGVQESSPYNERIDLQCDSFAL